MSGPGETPRRKASRPASWLADQSRSRRFHLVDLVSLLVILVIACWAVYPIYQVNYWTLTAGIAIVTGGGIAVLATRRGRTWPWWLTAAATVAGYVMAVIPAAIPTALLRFPSNIGFGFSAMLTAPVTSWKRLVTTAPPLGTFGDLLVPGFITVLLAALLAVLILRRSPQRAVLALIPPSGIVIFGIAAGPVATSSAVSILGLKLNQPREVLIGALWFLVALGLLSVRQVLRNQRVRTVKADGTLRSAVRGAVLLRGFGGFAVVALALIFAFTQIPSLAGDRTVIRSVVAPETVRPPLDSPLERYRFYFESAQLDAPVFTVKAKKAGDLVAGTSVRIATLPYYNSVGFGAISPDANSGFTRLAYRVAGSTVGAQSLGIVANSDLGSWMPTAGQPVQVSFLGKNSRILSSNLYTDTSTTGLLNLTTHPGSATGPGRLGLTTGDGYELTYLPLTPASEDATAPNTVPLVNKDDAPQLMQWVAAQRVPGNSVADVRALVETMMVRSYLGRSAAAPVSAAGKPTWLSELAPGYVFVPSFAGHSLSRLEDGIFAPMNQRSGVECSSADAQCAVTTGDEEQYAAAAALIARVKGFDSRVVVGAKVPEDGIVRGRNMSVWAEILTDEGTWAAIDVTPRVDNSFVEDDTQIAPEYLLTPIQQEQSETLAQPDQKPQVGSVSPPGRSDEETKGLLGFSLPVREIVVGGGIVFLLVAPWLFVLGLKVARRRRRRNATDPEMKIAGGWDEYLDRLVDYKKPPPGTRTRGEVATLYGGENAAELAAKADKAVFADVDPTPAEAESYWMLVDAELANVASAKTKSERWRSKFSWLSLKRSRKLAANM